MDQSLRKLVGTIMFVLFLAFYICLAIALAFGLLPGQPPWVHLTYALIMGVLWVFPAGWIIRWMHKNNEPG